MLEFCPIDYGRFRQGISHRPVAVAVQVQVNELAFTERPRLSVLPDVLSHGNKLRVIAILPHDVPVRNELHSAGEFPIIRGDERPYLFQIH